MLAVSWRKFFCQPCGSFKSNSTKQKQSEKKNDQNISYCVVTTAAHHYKIGFSSSKSHFSITVKLEMAKISICKFFLHFIWKKVFWLENGKPIWIKNGIFFHICKLIFFAFSNFAIIEEMASTKLSSCKSKTAKTDDLLNIYHEGSSSVSCLDTT